MFFDTRHIAHLRELPGLFGTNVGKKKHKRKGGEALEISFPRKV